MPVDEKIEIELELKDQSSAVIQNIAKSVSEVIKHMGELGKASSGGASGITHTTKSVKDLGEKTKDSNKELSGIAAILIPLSGAAGIAFGIGAGLVAAANALDKVAGSRLRLQNLSMDIGLTVDQISIMSKTFEKMGIGAEEAMSRVTQIGMAVKEMEQHGTGSQLFRDLAERGFADFARAMYRTVQAGEGYKAIQDFIAEANRLEKVDGPAAAARFTSTLNGMSDGIRKTYAERSKGVEAARQLNLETTKELRKTFEENKVAVWNIFAPLVDDALQYLNTRRGLQLLGGAAGGAVGYLPWIFDKKPLAPLSSDPLLLDPSKALKRKDHKFEFEKEDEDTKKETNSTLEKIGDSIKKLFGGTPKQHGGSVEEGKNYLVGEDGPGVFRPNAPGGITPSTAIEDRRGDPVPGWLEDTWGDIQNFRRNNPVAKWLYGEDYSLDHLRLPLAENPLGFPGAPDPAEIWTTDNYNQFKRGETPGSPTGRIRSIVAPGWYEQQEQERQELDIRLQTEGGGGVTSLDADITFRNVPPGVTTKADGEGFDNFKVNKSKSLEGM